MEELWSSRLQRFLGTFSTICRSYSTTARTLTFILVARYKPTYALPTQFGLDNSRFQCANTTIPSSEGFVMHACFLSTYNITGSL
jgi:hypothetical protein